MNQDLNKQRNPGPDTFSIWLILGTLLAALALAATAVGGQPDSRSTRQTHLAQNTALTQHIVAQSQTAN